MDCDRAPGVTTDRATRAALRRSVLALDLRGDPRRHARAAIAGEAVERTARRQHLAERRRDGRTRAMEAHAHGFFTDAEARRGLGGVELDHLAEHQDLAQPLRQAL